MGYGTGGKSNAGKGGKANPKNVGTSPSKAKKGFKKGKSTANKKNA